MFQLKEYQRKTLDVLEDFLKNARLFGEKSAFCEFSEPKSNYEPISSLENVPYICLRLPTGGGKTFLSAHSISIAAKNYLEQDYPVALWLTPSTIIKEQTVETLKNPNHPNRKVLESTFDGNVAIYDISEFENVRPQDLKSKACVFVSTIQSFRVDNKEGRRIYSHNENLESHFAGISNNTQLNLDRIEEGEDAGKIKLSFANLLYLHRPLVIVDEAHNNTTPLSYEVMNRVNPACIIEFTATPAPNSNVLYRVSAMELKTEEMIKLPIMLTELPSWQEAIVSSVLMRKKLEDIAKLDRDYIRPIVLIQAENKDKEVTVEEIKKYLIENENVSPERIAIATGEQRELDGINILDPNCPIEFVITMQALKEGWDCPFAYIFCSVATVNSKTAVEQLLGRVLRMPYAKSREQKDLNKAYAFVSTTSWPNAVAKLCDNLTNMGFDETEAENAFEPPIQGTLGFELLPIKHSFVSKIDTEKFTEEEKTVLELSTRDDGLSVIKVSHETPMELVNKIETAINKNDVQAFKKTISVLKKSSYEKSPSEQGEVIEIPQLKLFIDGEWEKVEKDLFLSNGWNLLDYPAILSDGEFNIRDDGRTIEIDIDGKTITERYFQNTLSLDLGNVETNWSNLDLSRWIDRKIYQPDITMAVKLEFIRRIIEYLNIQKGISLSTLIIRKFLLAKAIDNKINNCRKSAFEKGYQTSLFSGTIPIETSFDFSFKFREYYPTKEKYTGNKRFTKHFYPMIDRMNGEEVDCAVSIDSLSEVKYWVRNIEKQPDFSFYLPTSTDNFYPDFVVKLNDGRLFAIEYKGEYLVTSDDSKEKDNIGHLWEEKSNGKCLFLMVTKQDKDGRNIKEQITNKISLSDHAINKV